MVHPTSVFLPEALAFYDRMRAEYTARSAFGMAVAYLARKSPTLSFAAAEKLLHNALEERPVSR